MAGIRKTGLLAANAFRTFSRFISKNALAANIRKGSRLKVSGFREQGADAQEVMRRQAVPRCFQWNIVAEEEEASGLRGAATFASVSGRPRHAGWETGATTIGRANPKIAGSRPGGSTRGGARGRG